MFAESYVITHLIPFVTLGGSNDRKIIIGQQPLMTTNEKETLRPQESLRIRWENAQPGIRQVQNLMICTQRSHQAIVLLMHDL